MDISVIIPVHNAEKYLERCVESVVKALSVAKKTKGEVLLIDNDSSDGSFKMMKDLAKKYPKIISVLQCHTPSAGAVRNFGAKKAKGEFLWFVDADDTVAEESIVKLLSEARLKKADLVMIGMERVYPDGRRDYLPAISADKKDYKHRFVRYGMGPCQILVRREWWKKHDYAFAEGVIHEDVELMSALILDTDNFASIDEPLYYYWQNPGSVLHKEEYSPHVFDIFPALEGIYQRFVEKGAEQDYYNDLEYLFIWNLLDDAARDFRKFPEAKVGFLRSRKMLELYFPRWRKNKFLKQKPIMVRIRIRLSYRGR